MHHEACDRPVTVVGKELAVGTPGPLVTDFGSEFVVSGLGDLSARVPIETLSVVVAVDE